MNPLHNSHIPSSVIFTAIFAMAVTHQASMERRREHGNGDVKIVKAYKIRC